MSNEETALAVTGPKQMGVALNTLKEMADFAEILCSTRLAPKGLDSPQAVVIAIQNGAEIGLKPMQAVQNTAVINGRPRIMGKAALALVRSSGVLKYWNEEVLKGKTEDDFGYKVTAERVDQGGIIESTFTVKDAKRAKLWGGQGPWTLYPQRMLKWRARGYALDDGFSDITGGMISEIADGEPIDITEQVVAEPPKPKATKPKAGARLGKALRRPGQPPPPKPTPEPTPEPPEPVREATGEEEYGQDDPLPGPDAEEDLPIDADDELDKVVKEADEAIARECRSPSREPGPPPQREPGDETEEEDEAEPKAGGLRKVDPDWRP